MMPRYVGRWRVLLPHAVLRTGLAVHEVFLPRYAHDECAFLDELSRLATCRVNARDLADLEELVDLYRELEEIAA